ncbi:hypothetical protein ACLMJK_002432 [Lecanora helva]
MAGCAKIPLRRLFLIWIAESTSPSLQSLDAVIRNDPTAVLKDWRISGILNSVVILSPALSVAYKSLGGGHSHYVQLSDTVQIGLTGPPGTQNLGFGLSQFINATLPWFKDPGFPNRVYGFNLYIAAADETALLDGPMPNYVEDIQSSMNLEQSTTITADVAAVVCQQNLQLSNSTHQLATIFNDPNATYRGYGSPNPPTVANTWVNEQWNRLSMLLPDSHNMSNILVGSWSLRLGETFGDHLWQYTVSRQNYTGTWRITKSSIQLIDAVSKNLTVPDTGILGNNSRSLDLYTAALAEYDWRFRNSSDSPDFVLHDKDKYGARIKSDSTFIASMIWSRLAATDGPENWAPGTSLGIFGDSHPELQYDTDVKREVWATTIRPNWAIAIVLALNPALLLASLLFRIIVWPSSPIGEGFGLVSLLASTREDSRVLLRGAGFSGKLRQPVLVRFSTMENGQVAKGAAKIVTELTRRSQKSERLSKGVLYS